MSPEYLNFYTQPIAVVLGFTKRNIYLVSVSIPGTELLYSWDFLSAESNAGVFCYVNEVTFGKPAG